MIGHVTIPTIEKYNTSLPKRYFTALQTECEVGYELKFPKSYKCLYGHSDCVMELKETLKWIFLQKIQIEIEIVKKRKCMVYICR